MTQSPTKYVTQIRKQEEKEECVSVSVCALHFKLVNVNIVQCSCASSVAVTEDHHLVEGVSREIFSISLFTRAQEVLVSSFSDADSYITLY